jgi:thioredoxin:protein disulfide reductase
VLQPLAHLSARGNGGGDIATSAGGALVFNKVKSTAELQQQIAQASAAGKPVMLDFYADWCVSCKEMERFTFTEPAVRAKLAGAVLLKADVTANNADDKALLKQFNLFGPPGIILFNPSGTEVGRVIGFQAAADFTESLSVLRP